MNAKYAVVVIPLLLFSLTGCGGYGGDGTAYGAPYSVGGTVTGLKGDGFKIRNGAAELTLPAGTTTFNFPTQPNNSAYDVIIVTQPQAGANSVPQVCTVTNGKGTLNGANVSTAAIACADTLAIIITVKGLLGSGLVIQNNGAERPVAQTELSFTLAQLDGTAYNITVKQQPTNPKQACTINNGVGTMQGKHVTNVEIACAAAQSATIKTGFVGNDAGPGDWDTALPIDTSGTRPSEPRMAVNAKGEAFAVWVRVGTAGSGDEVWAARYTPAAGWLPSEHLDRRPESASHPQVAANASGDAIAVWVQEQTRPLDENRTFLVWSSRYTPENVVWSAAEIIGQVTSDRDSSFALPQIELADNGDALATWVENPGPAAHVWSNRYRAASRQWMDTRTR